MKLLFSLLHFSVYSLDVIFKSLLADFSNGGLDNSLFDDRLLLQTTF